MASTADSMEPWPVMMTTSVAGRRDLIWRSRSAPDKLGRRRSAMTMSGGIAGDWASAASALSASEQRYSSELPTVMHKRRMLCSSSTTRSRMRESSLVTDVLLKRKCVALREFPRMQIEQNSHFCGHAERADGGRRKADQKRAPFGVGIVAAKNLAVMSLDDSITNAEAEPRALSNRLGRKERLKNSVRV